MSLQFRLLFESSKKVQKFINEIKCINSLNEKTPSKIIEIFERRSILIPVTKCVNKCISKKIFP